MAPRGALGRSGLRRQRAEAFAGCPRGMGPLPARGKDVAGNRVQGCLRARAGRKGDWLQRAVPRAERPMALTELPIMAGTAKGLGPSAWAHRQRKERRYGLKIRGGLPRALGRGLRP